VKEGSDVKEGQLIGLVGNCNTSEPHLHIHAEIDGKGVPIKLNGKFLLRNNIVRVR
jgi:murein DD-endopeptidase MepM/ murein hydrolase activator NlpD